MKAYPAYRKLQEPMPDKKILVIDDQPSQLRIIKKILDRYGWQAVTADSAEEADLVLDCTTDLMQRL